jgi:hypothetical protein
VRLAVRRLLPRLRRWLALLRWWLVLLRLTVLRVALLRLALLWAPLAVRRLLARVALAGTGLDRPVEILVRAWRVLVRIDRCLWRVPGVRVLLLAQRRPARRRLADRTLAHRGLAGRALLRPRLHRLLCRTVCALLAALRRRGSGCARLP